MAAKKRLTTRTSVVERRGLGRRAELLVDVDVDVDAGAGRWARRVDAYPPSALPAANSTVSLVVDGFGFVLYAGDHDELTGDHDGDEFVDLAVDHGVEVFAVSGLDLRRARLDVLADAAAAGALRGAVVRAYRVDTL
ncbi:MAG: hypothetical protein AAF945_04770 [Actinomycetota bacterium]